MSKLNENTGEVYQPLDLYQQDSSSPTPHSSDFVQSFLLPDEEPQEVIKLATTAFESKKFDEALSLYEKAGNVKLIMQRAEELVEEKNSLTAFEFYNCALKLAPKDIKIFNRACVNLSYLGNFKIEQDLYSAKPIEWFTTDNHCSPGDIRSYWNSCGDLNYNLGDCKQALACFTEAEKQGPNLFVLYNRLEVSHTLGLPAKEIDKLYAQIAEYKSDITDFNRRLISAYVLLLKNDLHESYSIFKSLYDACEQPDLSIGLGQICLRTKSYQDASRYFDEVLQLYPNNLRAITGQADAQRFLLNHELALILYQSALKISPGYIDALLGYGRLLLSQGEVAQAIHNFNLVLKACPQNPQALQELARTSSSKTSYSSASSSSSSTMVEVTSSSSSYESKAPYSHTMFPPPPKTKSLIKLGKDCFVTFKDVVSAGTEIILTYQGKTESIQYPRKLGTEEKPAIQNYLKKILPQIQTRMDENLPKENWEKWLQEIVKTANQNNGILTYSQNYFPS